MDETQFTLRSISSLLPLLSGLCLSGPSQGREKLKGPFLPLLDSGIARLGLVPERCCSGGRTEPLCLCSFSLGRARDKGLQKEYASNTISHRHDDRDDLSLSETWCSKKERTQQAKQGKHSDSSPGSPRRPVGGWSGANCLVPGASRLRKWLELQTSLQK